jgi:hypothetical protein
MKKIKFSHWYFKLFNVYSENDSNRIATLLQALKINYSDLSNDMIKYDATYGNEEIYDLPKTDLIFLVFNAHRLKGGIFTTIRRYTPNKWEYYKGSEGETFEVIIKG